MRQQSDEQGLILGVLRSDEDDSPFSGEGSFSERAFSFVPATFLVIAFFPGLAFLGLTFFFGLGFLATRPEVTALLVACLGLAVVLLARFLPVLASAGAALVAFAAAVAASLIRALGALVAGVPLLFLDGAFLGEAFFAAIALLGELRVC